MNGNEGVMRPKSKSNAAITVAELRCIVSKLLSDFVPDFVPNFVSDVLSDL